MACAEILDDPLKASIPLNLMRKGTISKDWKSESRWPLYHRVIAPYAAFYNTTFVESDCLSDRVRGQGPGYLVCGTRGGYICAKIAPCTKKHSKMTCNMPQVAPILLISNSAQNWTSQLNWIGGGQLVNGFANPAGCRRFHNLASQIYGSFAMAAAAEWTLQLFYRSHLQGFWQVMEGRCHWR